MPRENPQDPTRPAEPLDWSDAPSRDAIQLIAEGVTQLAGFGVAAISAVRDDGRLEVMAVAGSDAAREQLHGVRTPVDRLSRELEKADDWGLLRFVPHERLDQGTEEWGWVPDIEPIDAEDAWHPLDLLVAPLYDDKGDLRGSLAIDLPHNGRRPGGAQRAVLNQYAEQARRAVLVALERERLAERVRMADAARRIVRTATAQLSLDRIVADSREALVEGFRAAGMWLQTFDRDDHGGARGEIYSSDGSHIRLTPELVAIAEAAARLAWEQQQAAVVAPYREFGPSISPEQGELVLAFLAEIGVESLLFTPLGAGPECLGNLVLTRAAGAPEWTEAEAATALDIGHDLGRAILNARTFEREHELVEELQELDSYKGRLIATVAHELKNPLSAILGYAEILAAEPGLSDVARASVAAIERGGGRLARVVDDLLLLHQPIDSAGAAPEPVDLGRAVAEVVDLNRAVAAGRRLTVRTELPGVPVLALAEARDVDHVVANLVGNALKYTPEGGTIVVSVERVGDEAVLTCSDTGIGIAAQEQAHLFEEFLRSTDPAAIAQPGTGLGLAIVHRVVERHRGRIELESELGRGSTFRVLLPATHAAPL